MPAVGLAGDERRGRIGQSGAAQPVQGGLDVFDLPVARAAPEALAEVAPECHRAPVVQARRRRTPRPARPAPPGSSGRWSRGWGRRAPRAPCRRTRPGGAAHQSWTAVPSRLASMTDSESPGPPPPDPAVTSSRAAPRASSARSRRRRPPRLLERAHGAVSRKVGRRVVGRGRRDVRLGVAAGARPDKVRSRWSRRRAGRDGGCRPRPGAPGCARGLCPSPAG